MLNAHIEDVRTFVAVADTGTVSAAARTMHVSQSAVTRRLQRLEAALGAVLVARDRRPVALTDAGVRALPQCRGMLAAAATLLHVGEPDDLVGGDLRLGVAHALTEAVLVGPMARIGPDWPRVRWHLSTAWSQELLERVRRGGLDAACVLLPRSGPMPTGLSATRIADEELLVVAPRTRARQFTRAAQLADQRWILNPEGCAGRALLQRTLGRLGVPLSVAMDAYSYELQLALVADGRGLGLVPKRLLDASAFRRRLAPVQVRRLAFPFGVWMVERDRSQAWAEVLAALRHVLVAQFDSHDATGHTSRRPRR